MTAHVFQACGAAITTGLVLSLFVLSSPRAGGEWSELLLVLPWVAWLLTPFAVVYLASRRFRTRRAAVVTLLVASVVLLANAVVVILRLVLSGPIPFLFILLPLWKFFLLTPFFVIAYVLWAIQEREPGQ